MALELLDTAYSSYEDSYFATFADPERGQLTLLVNYDDVDENDAAGLVKYAERFISEVHPVDLATVSDELRGLFFDLLESENDMWFIDTMPSLIDHAETMEMIKRVESELLELFPAGHCFHSTYFIRSDPAFYCRGMENVLTLFTSFQSCFWYR